MFDVTLWTLSVWGWFAAKRDSCWWFLCKRIPQKLNKIPVIWIKQEALIAVFIICSGRQLILYYDTHRLFFVSNHLTISLQAIAKVLHLWSLVPFPLRSHHQNIGCDTLEYYPLSFREKRSGSPAIKGICLNYWIQFDLESGSQIRSGMTNEILFSNPRIIRTCS